MERAITLLRSAGIADITIVTGHLHEQYDALASRLGVGVRTVFNPDFESHGTGRSLAVGLERAEGPLLLLESDILWQEKGLDTLLRHSSDSSLLTSGPTGAGDEVWVWAKDASAPALLAGMSKNRSERRDAPFGELVGLVRIGEALRTELLAEIRRTESADAMVTYEACLSGAAATAPVELLRIDGLLWGEVDDERMYDRVRDVVWPAIQASSAFRG